MVCLNEFPRCILKPKSHGPTESSSDPGIPRASFVFASFSSPTHTFHPGNTKMSILFHTTAFSLRHPVLLEFLSPAPGSRNGLIYCEPRPLSDVRAQLMYLKEQTWKLRLVASEESGF